MTALPRSSFLHILLAPGGELDQGTQAAPRSDRTSCTSAAANQFRLLLHTAAYWLLHTLRGLAPETSFWRDAQFDTIRFALTKVAARVTEEDPDQSRALGRSLAFPRLCPPKRFATYFMVLGKGSEIWQTQRSLLQNYPSRFLRARSFYVCPIIAALLETHFNMQRYRGMNFYVCQRRLHSATGSKGGLCQASDRAPRPLRGVPAG